MSTKQLIIHAAAEIFAMHSYEGLTIKKVAEKAGVSRSAVYVHFNNKADLFLQVFEGLFAGQFDQAARMLEALRSEPVRIQLYELVRSVFDFYMKEDLQLKSYMRLLLFPPKKFPVKLNEEMMKLEDKKAALIADIFERGMQNGEIKKGDSLVYAHSLICLMDGMFWQLQRHRGKVFWERLEVVWNRFWQGIAVSDGDAPVC